MGPDYREGYRGSIAPSIVVLQPLGLAGGARQGFGCQLEFRLLLVGGHEHPLADPVPMNYISDLSLITQELEWKPKIDLDEGLRSMFS